MTHPDDLLIEYAAGTLDAARAALVADHLRGCPPCRGQAASWSAVAGGVRHRFAAVAVPPPLPVPAPQRRASTETRTRPALRSSIRALARVPAILAYQRRLVPRATWPVSALVLFGGTIAAGLAPDHVAVDLLAAVVPLVATVAIAVTCGAGADPAAELVAATRTSRRVVLLARLAMVLGWVFGLAAAASLALAPFGPYGGPVTLLASWLGPAAALAAASFALSVLWRSEAGVGMAVAIWTVRALAGAQAIRPAADRVTDLLWSTSTGVLLAAGAATVILTLALPASDRWRPAPR